MLSNHQGHSEVLDRILSTATGHEGLGRTEEAQLAAAAARGDADATSRLVAANLRRVVAVARGYRNLGLPLEDLVHEGVVGFLEALRGFDAARNVQFFTYATFFVRRSIVAALARSSKTVRLPRQVSARLRRYRTTRRRLEAAAGRAPTAAETAAALGMTEAEAAELAAFQAPYEVSLDQPAGGGTDGARRPIRDQLATAGPDAADLLLEREHGDLLAGALARLPERSRTVLAQRFGLGGPSLTLRDLGAGLGLSKERVRQLEEGALHRMRELLGTGRAWPAASARAAFVPLA